MKEQNSLYLLVVKMRQLSGNQRANLKVMRAFQTNLLAGSRAEEGVADPFD